MHLNQLISLKIHMVPMCHNLKGMRNKVKQRFNKCKILQYYKLMDKEKKTDKYFATRTTQGAQPFIKNTLVKEKTI